MCGGRGEEEGVGGREDDRNEERFHFNDDQGNKRFYVSNINRNEHK